jgi:hypothetical protein
MEIVDREIRWVKKSAGKVVTPREFKRTGSLADWKKGLREPSPFARL